MGSEPLESVWLGTIPYREAHALQRRVHDDVTAGRRGHTLLLLEHPPVYTLGRRGGREHLHDSEDTLAALGVEVVQTDRGGLVTFHGPGQLVAYPIIHLGRLRRSLGWYIRRLLDATAATAVDLGVAGAATDQARPGIWVGPRKLASVGVRLTGGATLHGVALNLDVELGWFRRMSPCGLAVEATSVVEEGAQPVAAARAGARLHTHLAHALGLACASDHLEIT
ncbi:MAG: lipoyl(octanoyl) transferase LipB [Pseudomonadota bacterium]